MIEETRAKIQKLCAGKEYSTHHVSDENNMARIRAKGIPHVIIGDIVLEWLESEPCPDAETISKVNIEVA